MSCSRFLSSALYALLGSGCSAESAAGPRDVLRDYADALDHGKIHEAYAQLSSDAQRSMPYDAFERIVRENPAEIREISQSLNRPSTEPYVTATLAGPGGASVLLIYEEGKWHIDGSTLDLYSQTSPEIAVASFIRAFENGRYDVLMRFVPLNKQAGLDATKLKAAWEGEQRQEMQRLTQVLKASLPSAHIEQLGDRATLRYGAGATVELVREQGLWRVEEF